jgi:uncharacterized membrane protein YfcA
MAGGLRRRVKEPAADVETPAPGGVAELQPTEPDPHPAEAGATGYRVDRLPAAALGSVGAGVASALLGIGGGLIKVPLMHLVLGVPLRIATATSNLMIGITASASAIVYLVRGGIDAYVAGPTAIGVFVGASLGSRLGHRIGQRALRLLFVVVLLYTAVEMARRALGVG